MQILTSSLALFLLSSLASASTFFEQPFPEVVRGADTIVRGKIGKSEVKSVTMPDGSSRLFTVYDVQVTEGFKGTPRNGQPIQIREIGGEKDGVTLQISGTAQFTAGDDVVVMLGNATLKGESSYPLQGMMMGRFSVEKDASGKEYLEGPALGSTVHPGLRNENSPTQKDLQVTLEQLREIVRTQAKEPAPTPVASTVAPSPVTEVVKTPAPSAEQTDEVLVPNPVEERSASPFRPTVLALGVILGGGIWFLKSRKNRR